MSVKVLVVPVFGRNWLYHAWHEAAPQAPRLPWREGKTLGEKVKLLAAEATEKARARVDKQWEEMKTAKEGTMKHRLFKLAEYVLERVHPVETFFKALPREACELQFRHPTSIDARLIRRRLRRLVHRHEPFQRQRMYIWAALLLPQVPLVVLPLPNITIYYTLWRIISHHGATRGAASLASALERAADVQAYQLAVKLQAEADQGHIQLREGEWPAALVARLDELRARVEEEQVEAEQYAVGSTKGAGADTTRSGHMQDAYAAQAGSIHTRSAADHRQTPSSSPGITHDSGSQQSAASRPSRTERTSSHHIGGKMRRPKRLPVPQFIADEFLEQVVTPKERAKVPLDAAAVRKLAEHYRQGHIMDHFHAASRLCLTPEQRAMQRASM